MMLQYVLYFLVLAVLMWAYLRLAQHFRIVDQPNFRSSHQQVTVRGGGIIFPLALLFQSGSGLAANAWFLSGLLLISLVSFADDVRPLSYKIRLLVHFAAVSLLIVQLHLQQQGFMVLLLAVFFIIGTINAVNFMDGINGLTGLYALVTLLSLTYIDQYVSGFVAVEMLVPLLFALLIFLFFNFRRRAICFAGDVGSVSIAFILVFLVLLLISRTANPAYLLLFLVYGLDVISTIIFRIFRGENISEPHRSHFYQFLVHEKKMNHLQVALLYCSVQLLVNVYFIYFSVNFWTEISWIVLISGIFFVFIRFVLEGTDRLFKKQ